MLWFIVGNFEGERDMILALLIYYATVLSKRPKLEYLSYSSLL